MWLVVGLGNPGAEYAHNRHNIGFLAVDAIAGKLGASAWARKFQGEIADCALCLVPCALPDKTQGTNHKSQITRLYFLKPQTFMNLSGESVAAAARFYKIPPEHVIVLHDELDLLPGRLRVKQGGGDGGHNGIKSIDAHLGENTLRVRIGIGHPGDRNMVSNYVLGDFSKAEWQLQEKMIGAIAARFPLLLEKDAAAFMNRVALDVPAAVAS